MLKAGLVDEPQLFVVPVPVGSGKKALPADFFVHLSLGEVRGFGDGTVFLRFRFDS